MGLHPSCSSMTDKSGQYEATRWKTVYKFNNMQCWDCMTKIGMWSEFVMLLRVQCKLFPKSPFVKQITTLSILSPKYGPLVPDLSQDCVCRPRTHLLFLHPGENGLAVCAGTGLPPPARAQRGGGWDAGQVPVLSWPIFCRISLLKKNTPLIFPISFSFVGKIL